MGNTQVKRRSVSMPMEIDEYIGQLERRMQNKGCRFVFSNFVCELIEEHRAREAREQQSQGGAAQGGRGKQPLTEVRGFMVDG